jgi:hypothetical protein
MFAMRMAGVLTILGLTALAGCDSPSAPTQGAVVTFQVVAETFRVRLTTREQVEAAEAARAGTGPTIPNGRIVAGTDVNTGWSWHLEDVEFADVTIELCDGLPSDVEREGVNFALGRYCPWTARVISITR